MMSCVVGKVLGYTERLIPQRVNSFLVEKTPFNILIEPECVSFPIYVDT